MAPGKTNPLEYLRQTLDDKIKLLEDSTQKFIRESIRSLTTLRYRRNALAPVWALPTEVITAIFSFLNFPGSSPDPRLAWLHVTRVCHQWREIALNLPLFWSHIDFTNLTSAGAAEIVTRANKARLYLEATFSDGPQDVQPLQSIFFHDDTMCNRDPCVDPARYRCRVSQPDRLS